MGKLKGNLLYFLHMLTIEASRPVFAVVCANNVNRSTAAHKLLNDAGMRVCSYGAGRQVTFPGRTCSDFRTFGFLMPYAAMYSAFKKEDDALYTTNGVLAILQRNMEIKKAPERWQSLSNKQIVDINVIVCLDYVMFLTVLEGATLVLVRLKAKGEMINTSAFASYTGLDIQMRIKLRLKVKQLHIICLDTVDTPEEALTGGKRVVSLCDELNVTLNELTEDFVKSVVEKFEKNQGQRMFYLGLHM